MKSSLQKLVQFSSGGIPLNYDRFTFVNRNLSWRRLSNYLVRWTESRLRVSKPFSYPLGLQLEPTTRCQLNCPFCPRDKAIASIPEGDMEWESYQRLIDEVGPYLVAIAFWQWGEPLMHPKISEMIRKASLHGCKTILSTNAQVGRDFDHERLVSSGLDLLIISMDGATQSSCELSRPGSSLGSIIEFSEKVVAARNSLDLKTPLINVRMVATRDNEAETEQIRLLALKAGADAFSIKSVSLYYDDSPDHPTLPTEKALRSYQYQGEVEARDYRSLNNLCHKPWSWPFLRYNGELLCCECDHDMSTPMGNAFIEKSFKSVWQNEKAGSVRNQFPRTGELGLEFCRRCRYKIDDAICAVEYF